MLTPNSDKYQNYFDEYEDFARKNELGNKYFIESDDIILSSEHRVLKYKQIKDENLRKRVFLIVPSIFNSPEIFFLNKENHFIDNLRELGDIFLIDWLEIKRPNYSVNDYITEIIKITNHLRAKTALEIDLVGHCIGGTLALIAAIDCQVQVKTICLLTSPWDFSHFAMVIAMHKMLGLDNSIKAMDVIPKIHIQILFFLLFPDYFSKKIDKYLNITLNKDKELFFKIEQWLMSSNTLPKTTYFQIIEDMIEKNMFAALSWEFNNKIANPSLLKKPVYHLIAQNDRIVPASSILPLRKILQQSTMFEVKGGHISYLINSQINNFFKSYKSWLGGLK